MAESFESKMTASAALDSFPGIADDLRWDDEITETIKKLQKEQKVIRDRITARIKETGKPYATFQGMIVRRYKPTNKYAIASLISENPTLVEPYMRPVLKQELDLEHLRQDFPELVERYHTYQYGIE
jgi:hypothetical protein